VWLPDLVGALELAVECTLTQRSGADGGQAKLGAFLLKCAAEEGSYDLCMELLNLGITANVQDEDGNTPLHIAAKRNNMDFAMALCERGCHVMARNKHNRTPKMLVRSGDKAKHVLVVGIYIYMCTRQPERKPRYFHHGVSRRG
jgi:ankyrin repeat protein